MGMPTAAESSQLERLKHIAGKLRDGTATQAEKDESQAIMLEVYVAERTLGLVSVGECDRSRAACVAHTRDLIADAVKGGSWNAAKAAAVIVSVLSVCGTVAGIVIKLAG